MVKLRKPFLVAACFVLISGFCAFRVHADDWNKATIITTNVPIEVPGRILPAGRYKFKLMDSLQNRQIVRIMSADETNLYQTVLAIPDYREQATDRPVITFYETPTGGVSPVREWFYAGEHSGVEFIYPKNRGALLTAVTGENAPASETAATETQISETSVTETPAAEAAVTKEDPAPPILENPEVAEARRSVPALYHDRPFSRPPKRSQAAE